MDFFPPPSLLVQSAIGVFIGKTTGCFIEITKKSLPRGLIASDTSLQAAASGVSHFLLTPSGAFEPLQDLVTLESRADIAPYHRLIGVIPDSMTQHTCLRWAPYQVNSGLWNIGNYQLCLLVSSTAFRYEERPS